jgi:hypothetical protein
MSATRAIFLLGAAAGLGALLIRLTSQHHAVGERALPWHSQDDFTDLNEADPSELEKLGLDSLAVDRILEHRPYRNKLELVSRMIIPEALYGEIRHKIGVRDTKPDLSVHPHVA